MTEKQAKYLSVESRDSRGSVISINMDKKPDDEKVEEMYTKVLDQLLTPPHVRDKLIESQNIEQKWKLVQAHKNMFEKKSHAWGRKENALLATIESTQIPDIKSLSVLKVILSSANQDCMNAFLEANGILILINAIENRIIKKVLNEIDIAILFEIMLCFKLIMNNSTGMEGFLNVDGSIDTIAKCLNFNYKFFALQVLSLHTQF
jgi:hypothetical protein